LDLKLMARHCPNLRRTVPAFKTYWRPIAVWGLVSVTIFFVILEVLLPLAAHEIAYRMPGPWHQRIGDATLEQIKSFVALTGNKEEGDIVCRGEPGYGLLTGLTSRLTRGLSEPANIQLTVLNSKIVNAAALPGGHVVLFKGLIDFAEAPEEIAETLGHEIGHVVKRHPIVGAIESTGTSLLIGYLFGDVFGGTALAGLGQTILNSANTREAEREADAIGIDLARRLNIDGEKAAGFFDRLAKDEGVVERDLAFLSTHPASAERAAALRRQLTGKVPVWTESDWQAVRRVCD
jgi:Zn-dependent protease with chaperone function